MNQVLAAGRIFFFARAAVRIDRIELPVAAYNNSRSGAIEVAARNSARAIAGARSELQNTTERRTLTNENIVDPRMR